MVRGCADDRTDGPVGEQDADASVGQQEGKTRTSRWASGRAGRVRSRWASERVERERASGPASGQDEDEPVDQRACRTRTSR